MRLPCHAIALLLKSFDFPGFTFSMAWLPCNPCGFASSPAALLEQIKETVDEAACFYSQACDKSTMQREQIKVLDMRAAVQWSKIVLSNGHFWMRCQ